MGGVSIDAADNDVFAVTANTQGTVETAVYGEHILRFTPDLRVLAANAPPLIGNTVDYGSTPMLYAPPGCPEQAVAKNKSGLLVSWGIDAIAAGPTQKLTMAADTNAGVFIGVSAYSPAANLVYVGDPDAVAPFATGLVALRPQADCTLALAWQKPVGSFSQFADNTPPFVANGVVYFADGLGHRVYAYDAVDGRALWNSGSAIRGNVFTPPAVDGRVFVPSQGGELYAFGL